MSNRNKQYQVPIAKTALQFFDDAWNNATPPAPRAAGVAPAAAFALLEAGYNGAAVAPPLLKNLYININKLLAMRKLHKIIQLHIKNTVDTPGW